VAFPSGEGGPQEIRRISVVDEEKDLADSLRKKVIVV